MRNAFKISGIILFFFLVIAIPVTVYAATSNTKNVVLPKSQTITKDYFAAGETVTLSGTVNGDAYVAGGNVIIEGVVNGDLLAAGGTITIRGKVRDDVRVAGGQIIVSGDIGRNLTTTGGSVTITDSAKIAGSLTAGAGNLSIFAPIGKEANFGAGQVTLGNTINGDVQAGVGQLTLLPSAKVVGNLTYWSDVNALIDSGASISGSTTHNIPPRPTNEQKQAVQKTVFAGINVGFTFFSFLAALLIGLFVTSFAPVYVQETAAIITKKPLLSLGVGFMSMIIAPFIFMLLLITVVGIPAGLILLGGFFVLIYFAKIIIGIAIGQTVITYLGKKATLKWIVTLGLFLYYIITIIPILGFIFWIIAGLTGLGGLILQKKEKYSDLRAKRII